MWVEWDDDADLSKSQQRPGAYSPLTRDADRRLGHVTLSDVDEFDDHLEDGWAPDFDADATDEEWLTPEEIAALAATIASAFLAAKPHVTRWWKNQALPTIKSTRESVQGRFARTRKVRRTAPANGAITSVEVSPEGEHLSMTVDEARQRLLAAVVARAFSDEQVRFLMSARIEDTDVDLGLKSWLEQLTPEEFESQVSLMLDANPALVDELLSLFRGDSIGDSANLPPMIERPVVVPEPTRSEE